MSDCGEPCDACGNRGTHHLCDTCCEEEAKALEAKLSEAQACLAFERVTVAELKLEVERLRGILPELPPRAPDGGGLPRYGLYWRGPTDPLSVPMEGGYWTPWHLAKEALHLVVERQRQAMLAAINDDSYANYDGAEVVRILKAVPRAAEGEP